MAAHDQMHQARRQLGRQVRHLASTLVRAALATRVCRHDDEVGSLPPDCLERIADRGVARPERVGFGYLGPQAAWGAHSRVTDYAELHASALDDREWPGPLRPLPILDAEHIGREPGVPGLALPDQQRFDTPIELMIPHGSRIKTEMVQRSDSRAARGEIRLEVT